MKTKVVRAAWDDIEMALNGLKNPEITQLQPVASAAFEKDNGETVTVVDLWLVVIRYET